MDEIGQPPAAGARQTGFRPAALLAAVLLIGGAGCAGNLNEHGNVPKPREVASIEVGSTTRAQVLTRLGTPAAVATFDRNSWYYLGSTVEKFMFFDPELVKRDLLVIRFNDDEVVSAIDHLDKDDGRDVAVVARETETRGRSFSLLQQLIGNLGRFGGVEGR